MKLMRKAIHWIKATIPGWIICALGIGATLVGCLCILELPAGVLWGVDYYLSMMTWKYVFVNMATIGLLLCVLYMLTNRVWLAQLLCSVICWLVGTINYYVIQFHGMPLSFLLLKNFSTALNVLSAYHIRLDRNALRIQVLFVLLLAVALAVRFFTGGKKQTSLKRILLRDGILALVCCLTFSTIYLGEHPIKPEKTFTWNWGNPTASMVMRLPRWRPFFRQWLTFPSQMVIRRSGWTAWRSPMQRWRNLPRRM